MVIIIATGIEPVFVHDSTIQAHFDAISAEGNLVFVIFIQHQCFHRIRVTAIVVAELGDNTVGIYSEASFVGLFTISFFSRHCLSIGLDLRIQVSKSFAYCIDYIIYSCLNSFDLRIQVG